MRFHYSTWEASNTSCESDTLCDPAVLVAATNSDPHIRNRRLSPGSGNCGGGGGGGCISGGDQQRRQLSAEGNLVGPGHPHTISFRREKERKGHQHKGRSLRRESQKGVGRVSERAQKASQKERWVEDSLSLLKPPPAFPVQDSPAKLQPAVSYASKVKAGAPSGGLEEDRPAIGVLLQNQWGLSFISEARPSTEVSGLRPAINTLLPQPIDAEQSAGQQFETVLTGHSPEDWSIPVTTSITPTTRPEVELSNGKLLLSCRHLVEALHYHSKEWNAICNKQKKVPKQVVWYKET
uniref:Si:ch211-214j24.10 n=1 Tax=Gasterosteus aculeatus aculeatus TaxID=481459 RepID=A0AAQ4NSB2_GASAC